MISGSCLEIDQHSKAPSQILKRENLVGTTLMWGLLLDQLGVARRSGSLIINVATVIHSFGYMALHRDGGYDMCHPDIPKGDLKIAL